MPSLSFIGTGSGVPTADRFFSCTLLSIAGLHLLVDAGEPCVHSLRDRGSLSEELDAVMITHGHVDHIGGLPALLQGAMLLGRTKPLVICLPYEILAPLRAWIHALYLTEQALGFSLDWRAWKDGEQILFSAGETTVRVSPYANGHLKACYRAMAGADDSLPCNSYSLDVTDGGFRALFSGDLLSADELAPMVATPASVLVSELSHFDAPKLASVLQTARLKALCLVHLSEEEASDREDLRERMEELLPGVEDVFVPDEGEVLDF